MCSQVGFILGTRERGSEEIRHLQKLFIYLLLRSEERGPHATGGAWLDRDGEHRIYKRPVRASEFVKDRAFAELLAGVSGQTKWLVGHTRWQTRGDANNNRNNHPIRAGNSVIGTHNGTVLNADNLFHRFRLPRFAEVDSEIIFRMANAVLRDGRIDIEAFRKRLALFRGQMSAIMASKLDPETIVIVKGNKPLELRYHEASNVIVYASDRDYLNGVFLPSLGWRVVHVKPMSIATFRCDDLLRFSSIPFRLASNFRSFTDREDDVTDEHNY